MKLQNILEIDYLLLLPPIVLSIFGILFIYSSAITSTGVLVSNEYQRQILWAVSGVIIALVLAMVDYRKLYDLSPYLYAGTLLLLLYTYRFGRVVNGARSWIGIGSFGIQPSEFAKITCILFLARYLETARKNKNSFSVFIVSSIIIIMPMGLVLIEPDFGTSLVFIPILLVMTFISGVSIRYVFFLSLCIMLTGLLVLLPYWQIYIMRNAMPSFSILLNFRFMSTLMIAFGLILLIAFVGYMQYKKRYFYYIVYFTSILILSMGISFLSHIVIKDYQIMRLIVFLDPNVDPRGSGWHIIQSITAIGSGGLWGKGFLKGTQSHYRFLPQQSTDFIFSIFSEEWGLLGGLLVFTLFLLICLRMIRIIRTTTDAYGANITAGLATMYLFHFLINVGMTMGIMPITGIPLHFMSYGGSSMLAAMIGIGLSLSIYMRRYQH